MNKFYQKTKAFQWTIALLLLVFVFVISAGWFTLIKESFFYFFLLFLFGPVVQFALTPFLTLIGNYKYLSPMLLVYNPSNIKYDLHNGTSFDYLLVLKGHRTGRALKSKILEYYLEGLLKLVSEIENGNLSKELQITGSSYFFSDRSTKNLGFELSDASLAEKVNIIFNYLDLTWMYSIANGKLSFPDLKNVKNAKIKGKTLVQSKPKLEKLYSHLHSKNSFNPE